MRTLHDGFAPRYRRARLAQRTAAAILAGGVEWIGSVHVWWKSCCLAVALFSSAATAQEMKSPRVSFAQVGWGEVGGALAAIEPLRAADHDGDGSLPDAIIRLNTATAQLFPNIATTPVPVLLPFDTASFMRDWVGGEAQDTSKYMSGFHAGVFFYPGPSGYDAALSMHPQDIPGLNLTFVNRIDVQISGSALTYDLDVPASSEGAPVPELEADFPGIRRLILESHLRYTFVRYGVPYIVSLLCFDGRPRARRLACRDADKVAVRFLEALHVAGGAPQPHLQSIEPNTVERPEATSSTFTYYAPGDLIAGSGMRGQTGRADYTVFSKIRFPMEKAPAYANSQSFMNWGDCDHTGRVAMGRDGKRAAYRCRVNSKPLVFDESRNYAYPWRDNFCEHRYFYVGECPAGLGHQGQDIRPGWCQQRNEGADRCMPYQHNVVAVRDGAVLRAPGDMALYLVVDRPGEHIRFRYLHMDPKVMDADGLVSGRELHEGEVIGKVANYFKRPGGTTYHLHFDVQVPTRQGWVFVNPYMTLVAAYERLIGGRGEVVNDSMFAPPAAIASVTPEDGAQQSSIPPESRQRSGLEPEQEADLAITPPAQGGKVAVPTTQSQRDGARSRLAAAAIVVHRAKVVSKQHQRFERKSRKDKRDGNKLSSKECKAHGAKGHRRRLCGTDVAETRGGAKHARAVRSVDHHVSRKGERAGHHGRDVHESHARRKTRHGRV
jgi:hypothetical protein